MNPRQHTVFLFSLVFAALAAAFFLKRQFDQADVAAAAEIARLQAEITRVRQDNGRLQASLPSSPEPSAKSPAAARRESLLAVAQFIQDTRLRSGAHVVSLGGAPPPPGMLASMGLISIGTPAYTVDPAGQLDPRFGELFALTPAEVAQLQQRLDTIRDRLGAAVLAKTTTTRPWPETIVLRSPSLGDESARLREEWFAALHSALGDPGYQALLLLNNERPADPNATLPFPRGNLSYLFYNFAARPVTISVTRPTPTAPYSITTDTGAMFPPTPTLTDQIKQRFGAAMTLIPADF